MTISLEDAATSTSLNSEQREFVQLFRNRYPNLLVEIVLNPDPSGGSVISIRAPGASRVTDVWLWMEPGDVPSIGFGTWHTHGNCYSLEKSGTRAEADAIFQFFDAILEDKFVVVVKRGDGAFEAYDIIRQVDDIDEIEEVATAPSAPDHLYVQSWSGGINEDLRQLLDRLIHRVHT